MPEQRTALVVGSTGIVGGNLARHLAGNGWRVFGLARRPRPAGGVEPVAADLLDRSSITATLAGLPVTDIFIAAWLRHDTEADNIRVNGTMVEHLFDALRDTRTLQHATLVTGTKHYLGPFESYGQTMAETPFREDQPRLSGENFYYTQEDVLFRAAENQGFKWNVHRPHTIIGYALGNAMNMGVTLAVYGTICRETGRPFVFPGSTSQWNYLTDLTDARLLAQHLEWSALNSEAHNQAFNTVNGDIFRWRWLWPQLAAYFGIEPIPPAAEASPLELQMQNAGPIWEQIASKHRLAESRIDKLVSWWHTDADLGRQIECVNDMTRSRSLGFAKYQHSPSSFFDLFETLSVCVLFLRIDWRLTPMNVVLFGATGKAGSRILKELLAREHSVVGVARNTSALAPAKNLTVKQDDLTDVDKTAAVIDGADAVVSAYGPPPDDTDALIGVTNLLIEAVRKAGAPRLIVVGGAASLYVAPGVTLLDSGHLPEAWRPIATSHKKAFELLKASDIDWTYFSPAAFFEPGTRTGKFRLGQDDLISDGQGQSRISMEDYAIALVDELEKPAHRKSRFTGGY